MRKWLIVVMFLTVLFTHSEKVEASSTKQNNSSSTEKSTLTEDYLEGIWGNQNGFVCEFHSGDFIGFPKKTSTYLETYNYQIVNNYIKLSEAGTYVCKLSVKVINADCIQINGIKAYRAGSKKADNYQTKLQKAFIGKWFDCDLSDYLYDQKWQFTKDTAYRSYTVPSDDGRFEKLEDAYYIHEFQFYYSGDITPYYIRYSKDELILYRNFEEIHLLRMNSAKLKGFLNGDNIFTGNYVVKDSLYYGNELIEVSFVDDTKEPVDLDNPDKIAMECKFSWDGHELTMTLGDETYKIYLYGQQRTLVLGDQELVLVPEEWKNVKEYKKNKKIQSKNGNVESRAYTYYQFDQDAVKYLKLSFKCENNIVLSDYIYGESNIDPFYTMGTYGEVYRIKTNLNIKNGKISLVYRPEYLKYKCEDDLAIAYSKDYDGAVTILESTVDSKNHTVTAKYCGQGYYQLIDRVLVEGGTHDLSQENLAGNAWAQTQETGDILKLIDIDYLHSNDGYFKVSNASQLATAVYYANTQNEKAVIELTDDIDLSSYEWAPLGWHSGYYTGNHSFQGEIIGNHHKITGLTIHSAETSGFVGLAEDCTISDLVIEDAKILSCQISAILVGDVKGGLFKNCSVSGSVVGSYYSGSMFGYDDDGIITEQCTANVTVNGKEFTFLSMSDSERRKYVINDPIQLTINDEYVIQGTGKMQYNYMRWAVYLDGHRIAEQEVQYSNLEYKCDTTKKGEYIVYLEGLFVDYFIPVSNKITFKIE